MRRRTHAVSLHHASGAVNERLHSAVPGNSRRRISSHGPNRDSSSTPSGSRSSDIGYAVSQGLFSRGVLIGGTLFNSLTLRMEPPAVITYEQMDKVLERLDATLADVRVLPSQGGLVAH